MLLIILFWAWAAAVGLGLGLGLACVVEATCGRLPRLVASSPELLIFGGLAALAWIAAVLSFVLPVALPMQLGLSGLAAVAALLNRRRLLALLRDYGREWRAAGAGAVLLAAALALLVLTHAAQPPAFPDSALYHAQFIQWLHRYPLVPGLGNLESRLAFNSHAHLLAAFFSPADSPGRGVAFQQTVSSLGFLLLTLQHVRRAGWQRRAGRRPWLAGFYLGSLVLLLMALRSWISSPLADSTAAVLGLLLLGMLLETPRLPRAGLVWLALLAATAVTVKTSAGMLLLWPLVVAWGPARWRQTRVGLVAGVVLLVLVPWLGRNVGLSGYLVYPLAGQVGPVVREWAVPPAQLTADVREIRFFARRPLGDWPLAAGQPVGEWLPLWWTQQEPADKRLLLLVMAGIGLVVGRLGEQLLVRKTALNTLVRQPGLWLYALLLLSCGGWFVAAPALRFGYAYLIGAAVLAPLLVVRTLPARLGPDGWRAAGRACAGVYAERPAPRSSQAKRPHYLPGAAGRLRAGALAGGWLPGALPRANGRLAQQPLRQLPASLHRLPVAGPAAARRHAAAGVSPGSRARRASRR